MIVTTGMMGFVQSNAELAEVIGHEIAHVDLRHAVERHQFQYRLGPLVELFHRLITMPYSADQELDADAEGLRLASAAGYDPAAAPGAVRADAAARGPRAGAGARLRRESWGKRWRARSHRTSGRIRRRRSGR